MANYIPGIDKSKKFLNNNVQPLISDVLGIKDEGELAIKQAKQSAKERTNMGIVNQDAYEDTLRHMLLGAYTTSESSFPNPIDLGKRIGGALINFRELGEGYEGNIDKNNNNMGKLLAEFRLSKKGGGLRGDALKEQIFEDAKMLAASVDKTFTSSKSDSPEKKEMRDYLYAENGLLDKLDSFLGSDRSINTLKPKLSTTGRLGEFFKMNQGGIVDNQMVKAFAIGGEVTDPISGNEVPEGSFPNEVRDDVPAMLSEGEYVVPADVLRFYGLKFFEDLRGNAKMELTRMAQDGRMGGDPIQESQSLTDTDVTSLERMMRNANNGSKGDIVEMAKGGLIDKLAHTIKTDNGVNQRLAKGGVVIKMAPGGLVSSSLYQDPTKMDEIIKEVTAASKTNPALFQRLASKGVVLDKTNATMDPEEMLDKNKPMFNIETGEELVTAAEGGLIGYSHGGYHGDLFTSNPFGKGKESSTIDERYSNETGDIITKHYKLVDGIKMLTGYTRDSNPDRKFSIPPLEIPSGFNQLITTPTTELDNLNVTNEYRDGPDGGNEFDHTAWSKDINFNDPKSVQGWMDDNPKSEIPGIIGIATNINNEHRAGVIASLAETSGNKQITSMMKDYLSGYTSKPNSLTGKIKSLFTNLPTKQRNEYIVQQMENFTPKDPGGSITGEGTGFSGGDTGFSFGDISPNDTGFGSISVGEAGRPSGSNTMSGGSSSSSEGEAPSSNQGNTDSADNVDFSQGPPGFGDTAADKDNTFGMDGFNMNKGGLASKKSKKSYNKGGYSTNKKMNTGGLVKKKKKK